MSGPVPVTHQGTGRLSADRPDENHNVGRNAVHRLITACWPGVSSLRQLSCEYDM